jgi:hypothetical protein
MKEELLAQGYGAVVKGRVAHRTDGDCWSEKDWLIPLKDMEEAVNHGYQRCRKCGSISALETSETKDI